MKVNGKYQSLLNAEKKPRMSVKRMVFYLVLLSSIILLISFFTSLGVANTEKRSVTDFITFPEILESDLLTSYTFGPPIHTESAAIMIISLPSWGIAALIASTIGFSSTALSSSLSKTMILEDKNWLKPWIKKGKMTFYFTFRSVKLNVGEYKINILKYKNKYQIKIPLDEKIDLSKYGFLRKKNYFMGYFVREELSSTIHLIASYLK